MFYLCTKALSLRSTKLLFFAATFHTVVLILLLLLEPPSGNQALVEELSNDTSFYDLIHEGTIDAFGLSLVRIIAAFTLVLSLKLFGPIKRWALNILYWTQFACTTFLTAKLIVFRFEDAIDEPMKIAFVVLCFLFACEETFFAASAYKENGALKKKREEKKAFKNLPAEIEGGVLAGQIEEGKHVEQKDEPAENEMRPPVEDEEQEKLKPQLTFGQLSTLMKSYFWPKGVVNKLRCFMTFTFLAASRVSRLFSPLFIGAAVDGLSDAFLVSSDAERLDARNEVFKNIAIFCALSVLQSYFSEMQRIVYLKVGQVAYVEIAERTFRHLHSLSLDWHLKKKLGNVLRSMDRGVEAANTVVRLLFLSLIPTVIELAAVFIIFYKTFQVPLLSAVLFLAVIAYGTFTYEITMWRKKFRKRTNKHDNDFHDKATDSIINYETVKYFSNEDFEVKRYVESIYKYQVNANLTIATLGLLNGSQQTIIQASIMGALFIVTADIFSFNEVSSLSVGDFVTAQIYMMNVFGPLSWLGMMYNNVIQALVDITNLSELLAQNPDITDSPEAKPFTDIRKKNGTAEGGASVEFKELSFHYPSNDKAGLTDVSFYVPPGTSLAIVGHTGAGKTTLVRMLFRFYDPVSGGVLLDGIDIRDMTQKSLRQAIGVVPQDTVLFNESIRHNIEYGKPGASDEEIEAACRSAQIFSFIQSLPKGFDTNVGERGLRLSGGEKQRIAIARCLLKNPPIVLLDEATSALDTRTERNVQEALTKLTTQRTTLIIAHRLSTIKNADDIIVLESGSIVEQGRHQELLKIQGGNYASMWTAQLKSTTEEAIQDVGQEN